MLRNLNLKKQILQFCTDTKESIKPYIKKTQNQYL